MLLKVPPARVRKINACVMVNMCSVTHLKRKQCKSLESGREALDASGLVGVLWQNGLAALFELNDLKSGQMTTQHCMVSGPVAVHADEMASEAEVASNQYLMSVFSWEVLLVSRVGVTREAQLGLAVPFAAKLSRRSTALGTPPAARSRSPQPLAAAVNRDSA